MLQSFAERAVKTRSAKLAGSGRAITAMVARLSQAVWKTSPTAPLLSESPACRPDFPYACTLPSSPMRCRRAGGSAVLEWDGAA